MAPSLLIASSRGIYIGSFLKRVRFRIPLIRVPYYNVDRKRDPNLENYPYAMSGQVEP